VGQQVAARPQHASSKRGGLCGRGVQRAQVGVIGEREAPAQLPPDRHGDAQPQRPLSIGVGCAIKRRRDVGHLEIERVEPGALACGLQMRGYLLRQRKVDAAMALAQIGDLAGLRESIERVLANRLQQPVAHARAVLLDDDERLVDQRSEQVEDRQAVEPVAAADFLHGVERPAAGEYRQAPEQHPLLLAQQV
jgi:hypothetical protein